MTADHMACLVGILDVRYSICIVYTVPVVAVEEKCRFGASVGERVGNLPQIDVGTWYI